jgi:hypothetical protein
MHEDHRFFGGIETKWITGNIPGQDSALYAPFAPIQNVTTVLKCLQAFSPAVSAEQGQSSDS